ncbi:pentatricopeptide repeat-containing protein At4g13650-like [Magnolia sinica]|uniref:pentatricopeptide repeat-containing protein At4g13650-like n=1 Tax=Magnolia sinica TaxID=86752 RepID=UPI00265A2D9A|nr:pentatricopeptide repeat-containing protein At4g13650-like [Magnolia sinica]
MNLSLKFLKSKQTQQKFPLLNGKSASGSRFWASEVDFRPKSRGTQIAEPGFFISILRNCAVSRSLRIGQMAHCCILRIGIESDLFVVNNLLHMYCSCGSISAAVRLFDGMRVRDVVSWNTVISGFVRLGFFGDGFHCFRKMKREGISPSQSSFASVLVASVEMGSFKNCRQIHGESLKCGLSSDYWVANSLMTAYIKCGEIMDARKVFDRMPNFDEISIEILLKGYKQHGNSEEAFELFRFSRAEGIDFSSFTLSSLISLCSSLEHIDYGIQIHVYVVKLGLDLDVSTMNSLITFYARSYLLEDAICLFDCLRQPDVITWNSLIGGHAVNGFGDVGISIVGRFLCSGMRMTDSTFWSFLSCCATVTVLENAKKAHVLILKLRDCMDEGTDNVILTMYCRCGSLSNASALFKTMEERDVVSFNLLIRLFRDHCFFEQSIKLFCGAHSEGFIDVDEIMYSSVISSCAKLACLEIGQQIHGQIIKTGFETVFPLGNSLLGMYSQCGSLDAMERIFSETNRPDQFTWNIMIMGYACYGFVDAAIRIWQEMKELGVEFNEFSYCAMIGLCDHVETLVLGEQIQAHIIKSGLIFDTALMNSVLTMYANCGMIEKAFAVFKEIHSVDSISWNSMISAYAQNGFAEESLRFYLLMTRRGIEPNHLTFVSISKACTVLAKLALGLQFHAQVIKRAFESDVSVSNAFITTYAKCGSIHDSFKIFQSTIHKDVITWNSMVCGYAHHGCGKEALEIFAQMKISDAKPNEVTFVSVLSACSHAGLILEAWDHFYSMPTEHGITPNEEHYACMVDILCRAGQLREAKDLIESMPFDPCSLIWRTLLSACRDNENVGLGEEAAARIMQLEPHDSAAYVLLSNIYALVERKGDKAEMRKIMKDRGVKKEVGFSWI